MRDVTENILAYNAGRIGERLRVKYSAMTETPFIFFRGTAHVYYDDWPKDHGTLNAAPNVWAGGDCHLRNFGGYKADNRLVYFDVNDFDEGALAPATWDLARLLTSVHLALDEMGYGATEREDMCVALLESYSTALLHGPAYTIERKTAEGVVRKLLKELKKRKRKDFLKERTDKKKDRRHFDIGEKGNYPLTDEEREAVTTLIDKWRLTQPDPDFYEVLDVANRYAGVGSLGVSRYIILVEGNGSPNKNYLLDLKQIASSVVANHVAQPPWQNDAARVVALQARIPARPPALLAALTLDGVPYALRELQPYADKVKMEDIDDADDLRDLLVDIGQVVAWGQLRSSGWRGSATADDLIAFAAAGADWHGDVLQHARTYTQQVERDYADFRLAVSSGRVMT